jgi:hypothetical protein
LRESETLFYPARAPATQGRVVILLVKEKASVIFASTASLREHKTLNLQPGLNTNEQQLSDQV